MQFGIEKCNLDCIIAQEGPTSEPKEEEWSMAKRKKFKLGVKQGGGPPPGYQWSVSVIDFVFDEAIAALTEPGYCHMAMQVRELAAQNDPTHSDTVDVKSIESFFEIRDHGGPYGNNNVRAFFGVDKERRHLIFLGAIKKPNNGPTPQGDKITMRRRWRKYQNGDYGFPPP
jgi:hypothetical protein